MSRRFEASVRLQGDGADKQLMQTLMLRLAEASRLKRLRVFRSCPLITPKDPCSSSQMLVTARELWLRLAPRSGAFWRAARTRSKYSQPLTPRVSLVPRIPLGGGVSGNAFSTLKW